MSFAQSVAGGGSNGGGGGNGGGSAHGGGGGGGGASAAAFLMGGGQGHGGGQAHGGGGQGDANNDPLLREVTCEEDRFLIMQVLQAIRSCRREPDLLCTSWTVTPSNTGYVIIAYLARPTHPAAAAAEVTHDDMNLIEAVNILRVRVGVVLYQHGPWGLKISITGHRSAVSFSTYDSFCTTRLAVRRTLLLPSLELATVGGMAKKVLSYFTAGSWQQGQQGQPKRNNTLLGAPRHPTAQPPPTVSPLLPALQLRGGGGEVLLLPQQGGRLRGDERVQMMEEGVVAVEERREEHEREEKKRKRE